ncbi:MAG: ubiquinol-cytochrome c reductase iron-sulfur subunit [Proteobacteria bacterium]|nr:ubiquinol-cytochrome c reductase iron-sulfur subunit [Pseudomonadota bacterium]
MSTKTSNNDAAKEQIKDVSKRDFVTTSAYCVAGIGAACTALPFIDSMNPAKDVAALASVEVDISKIKVGEEKKVMWRGKPVFIKRRSKQEIAEARNVELSELKDPQADSDRVKEGKEEWLVTIGICTHLGCIPIGGAGEYKGWFCPCHGSVYDTSARIRKGPAPKNLAVPPYAFLSDNLIKIG